MVVPSPSIFCSLGAYECNPICLYQYILAGDHMTQVRENEYLQKDFVNSRANMQHSLHVLLDELCHFSFRKRERKRDLKISNKHWHINMTLVCF